MSERPLECSQCKKSTDIIYREMVGEIVTTSAMCRDCPILKQKLGEKNRAKEPLKRENDLCCNNCHTSFESILMGEPLGCKECYTVFQEALVDQLMESQLISPRLKTNPASATPIFHIGKTPHIDEDSLQTNRMHSLNKSLSEALKGENYEEAAWLRDQITALTEGIDERA